MGDFAIILAEDSSKPLRFLYLTLLVDKNRLEHIKTLILKLRRIIAEKLDVQF